MRNAFKVLQRREIAPSIQKMLLKNHFLALELIRNKQPNQINYVSSCTILSFTDELVLLNCKNPCFFINLITFICCNLSYFTIYMGKHGLCIHFIAHKHANSKLIISHCEKILYKDLPLIFKTFFEQSISETTNEQRGYFLQDHIAKLADKNEFQIISMAKQSLLLSANSKHIYLSIHI